MESFAANHVLAAIERQIEDITVSDSTLIELAKVEQLTRIADALELGERDKDYLNRLLKQQGQLMYAVDRLSHHGGSGEGVYTYQEAQDLLRSIRESE